MLTDQSGEDPELEDLQCTASIYAKIRPILQEFLIFLKEAKTEKRMTRNL